MPDEILSDLQKTHRACACSDLTYGGLGECIGEAVGSPIYGGDADPIRANCATDGGKSSMRWHPDQMVV